MSDSCERRVVEGRSEGDECCVGCDREWLLILLEADIGVSMVIRVVCDVCVFMKVVKTLNVMCAGESLIRELLVKSLSYSFN